MPAVGGDRQTPKLNCLYSEQNIFNILYFFIDRIITESVSRAYFSHAPLQHIKKFLDYHAWGSTLFNRVEQG